MNFKNKLIQIKNSQIFLGTRMFYVYLHNSFLLDKAKFVVALCLSPLIFLLALIGDIRNLRYDLTQIPQGLDEYALRKVSKNE